MHHLVFVSTATVPFREATLLSLLETMQRNNAPQQVTGVLLHGHRQFLLLLEGERAQVARLFARIYQDLRHTELTVLHDEPVSQQCFEGCYLSYASPSPAALARDGVMPLKVLMKHCCDSSVAARITLETVHLFAEHLCAEPSMR